MKKEEKGEEKFFLLIANSHLNEKGSEGNYQAIGPLSKKELLKKIAGLSEHFNLKTIPEAILVTKSIWWRLKKSGTGYEIEFNEKKEKA